MQLNKHIAALCIGTFCLGVAELGIVPVLTAIANDFHVTIPQAGLYISAYAAGVCAGIVGLLAFGRNANLKTTLLIAAGLIFCGNLGASLAQNDIMMLAARFVSGSPHGIFFALSAVVCERLAESGKASRDVTLMVLGRRPARFFNRFCFELEIDIRVYCYLSITFNLSFNSLASLNACC